MNESSNSWNRRNPVGPRSAVPRGGGCRLSIAFDEETLCFCFCFACFDVCCCAFRQRKTRKKVHHPPAGLSRCPVLSSACRVWPAIAFRPLDGWVVPPSHECCTPATKQCPHRAAICVHERIDCPPRFAHMFRSPVEICCCI